MNKQFEIIPMEVNAPSEVAIKSKSPALKLLKYALIGVAVFLALVILFTLGANEINPTVEGFMQKIGMGEQFVVAEKAPVAYAWSNPAKSGTSGINYVNTLSTGNMVVANQTNVLVPQQSYSTWNYGHSGGTGGKYVTSSGMIAETKETFTVQILFYVDIYIDDFAYNAIKNRQITSCSVAMHVEGVGTANGYDMGTIYGTFFLCSSETGSAGAGLNDMGSTFKNVAVDKFDDKFYLGRNNYDFSGSINLVGGERKIRFGIYYYVNKSTGEGLAWSTPDCYAPAPTITSAFDTDDYKNGTLKLQVGGDAGGGNIVPVASGSFNGAQLLNSFEAVASYNSSYALGGTAVINDIKAQPNAGYFFSGWKISSGSLSSSPSLTSTTFSIKGGPYLKASTTTTVTAYFRKITINEEGLTLTYLQELASNGNLVLSADGKPTAIQQGPYVTIPAANSDTGTSRSFTIVGGNYTDTSTTFSSSYRIYQSTDGGGYNSDIRPTKAGTYRMVVGVFFSGDEKTSSKVLGSYIVKSFTIGQVNVAYNVNDPNAKPTSSNIATRPYSGNPYTPEPGYVDVTVGGRPYRMLTSTDFTINNYVNNVNLTRDAEGEIINGAYAVIDTKGNFTGQTRVSFGITPLDVGDFTYESAMAVEIQKNHNIIYTGYEQRPGTGSGSYDYGVIAIRITGRVLKAGPYSSYDPENPTQVAERTELKTFTLYIGHPDDQNAYNNALGSNEYWMYEYEPFTDKADGSGNYNGVYDAGESFEDKNGNGIFDVYPVKKYEAIDRSNGDAGFNYFYVLHQTYGDNDLSQVYSNNYDVCEYGYGNNLNTNCASFDIMLLETRSNMYGGIKVYFNINPLDLDAMAEAGNKITVTPQKETHVYTSNGITPVPNVVYVTVNGLYPYLYNETSKTYNNSTMLPITYSFARANALKYEDSVLVGDAYGKLDFETDIDKSVVGENYFFEYWNATFGGVRPADFSYSNNVNVSSEAKITFALEGGGNVIGTITTNFTITPRSLDEIATGFGESSTQKVGVIVSTGAQNVVTYQGATVTYDKNGNAIITHIPVETTSVVQAYPDGTVSPKILTEGVDFEFSFSNNTTVTQNAVITVTGKGNYQGSIWGTYYIAAMDVSKVENLVDPLDPEPYTGKKISPQPSVIIINVGGEKIPIERYKDYNIVSDVDESTNLDVSSVESKQNFITISFTGHKKGSANQGVPTGEVYGNYYGTNIKVYFEITKKSLTDSDVITYANWSNYKSQVTYTGVKIDIEKLSLITDNNEDRNLNTLYLCDTTANPDLLLEYQTDYKIYGWGDENDNIDAGEKAGRVFVEGLGNYTGIVEINFRIYPRSISTNEKNITVQLEHYSYSYTGSMIEPIISSVKDEGISVVNRQALAQGVDFDVIYGGESDDGLMYNVDVLKGGLVTIVGKGNYQDSMTVEFEITKIQQTIKLENPYLSLDAESAKYNPTLALETKAKDDANNTLSTSANNGNVGVLYADYEINASAGTPVIVVAYTDAVAPLRLVKIKAVNINKGTSNVVSVTYLSLTEYVDENGKKWAKTTAKLSFTGNYGIFRIYAVQEDETITNGKLNNNVSNPDAKIGDTIYQNRGNYYSYNHTWGTDDVYSIYAKRQDTSAYDVPQGNDAIEITKVYGNKAFTLTPTLSSNGLFNYSVAVDGAIETYIDANGNNGYDLGEEFVDLNRNGKYDADVYVVKVEGTSGPTRKVQVGIVGDATITIYHDGYAPSTYVNEGDDANAYVAFSVDVKVKVKPRNLTISFEELTVPYGATPEFVYTFTTAGGQATSEKDDFKGLTYENRTDDINDILTGYRALYIKDDHGSVDKSPYSIEVFGDESEITKGDLYYNYEISYKNGILKVEKKLLTVSVSMDNSAANTLSKVYGSDNPTEYNDTTGKGYKLSYSGFENNESESTLGLDGLFTKPSLDFEGKTVIGVDKDGNDVYSQAVTKYSDVNGYVIALTGGTATNYYFETVKVDLTISPAPVVIKIGNTVDGEFIEAEDGVAILKTYDGKVAQMTADNVSIQGLGEGATTPKQEAGVTSLVFLYVYGTNETNQPQSYARTYAVKVVFNAAAKDNYTTTTVRFEGAIVIEKAPPNITLNNKEIEYTGRPIEEKYVQPTISKIPGAKELGETKYNKLLFGTDPSYTPTIVDGKVVEYDESKFTTAAPTEIGVYDVLIVYVANADDCYCDVTVFFDDVLEITTGIATVEYTGETNTIVYDGKGHGISASSDFKVTFRSEETGEVTTLYNGTTTLEYSLDGINWTSSLPVDVGVYTVKATYTPEPGAQIRGNTLEVSGVIVITPFDLATDGYISVELNTLNRYHIETFNGLGHPLQNSEIVINPVPEDAETEDRRPRGTISVVYVNTRGEEFATPINAGSYNAIIRYIANENEDNYYASSEVNVGLVLEIQTANVTIEDMLDTHTYSFTGSGVSMPPVYFHGVELAPGQYDQPKGSLVYRYRLSGSSDSWSEELPVNAGKYDVLVTYRAYRVQEGNSYVVIDNYTDHGESDGKEGIGVIVINAVTPNISINNMVFDFGTDIAPYYDVHSDKFNAFVLRGAQFDANGPMQDVKDQIVEITVEYGRRYTNSQTNKIEYEWDSKAPTASGKYSVKVIYQVIEVGKSNYVTHSVNLPDVLTINNIIPWFKLEKKEVYYSGNRISANQATIYDSSSYANEYIKWQEGMDEDDNNYYYGTIGYEYRRYGTDTWLTSAPTEVGLYDVRIRYHENTKKDSFTATTLIVDGALEIKQLVITVMPLYGQGNVYDGSYTDGEAIAYVYSYERDNYKYMVYSRVGDLERDEIIDISSATYVDTNGYVYTIVTDTSLVTDAWLDYYTKVLTLGTGSFVDGDTTIEFNYSDLSDVEGKVAYTANNGKQYDIDLDREIVYLNDGINYTLGVQTGYYFSEVNGEGEVNVISIDPNKVVNGIYSINSRRYTVNLSTLKVVDEYGVSYDIYRTVGQITYPYEGTTASMLMDYNSYYYVGADGKAIYKHSSGSAFLIDLNTSVVERIAILKVETASFNYFDLEGEEKNVSFNVGEMTAIYGKNAYVGTYKISDYLSAIIDLKAKTVRIQTYYTLKTSGSMFSFIDNSGSEDLFSLSDLSATNKENVYFYGSAYGSDYYVDLSAMIVRSVENLYKFDASRGRIFQENNGIETSFEVDVREFTYNVLRNGELYDTTTLYDVDYDVEKATLIAGNYWSGAMRLGAQNAGSYNIGVGSLNVGGNYGIVFVDGITYNVERARLTIEFFGDEDTVYDGQGKYVGYQIYGLVSGENENALNVRQEYEGDNVNVTENGYRTKVTISSLNYYLVLGQSSTDENVSVAYSERYYVEPATMAPIVFVRGEDIVYDGLKHYLELKNVERGAKVTYSGSTTAPYFREPGIYSVIATVTKDNYVSQEVELILVITKAKYEVNALEVPGTLTYGDPLPALRTDSQLGTIALDPGQVLLPGVTTYTWTFTPYDQEFYRFYEGNAQGGNTITGTIELKVQKAQANIQISGNLVQSETSPSAIVGIANGLSHNESDLVTIEYIASDGTRYATMPTSAGKYTVLVTYAGDEYHAETVYSTILTIEAESNYDWLVILGSVLLVLSVVSTAFFLIRGKRKKLD